MADIYYVEPTLCVNDVWKMSEFLEQALGFKRGFWHVEEDGRDVLTLEITSAHLSREHKRLTISGFKRNIGRPAFGGRLMLHAWRLEALHFDLKNRGYSVSELKRHGKEDPHLFRLSGPEDFVFVFWCFIY